MGRMGDHLGLSSVVLFLLLGVGNVSFVHCQVDYYWISDLDVLQAVLAAWNATPDITTNLDGWNKSQPYPCYGHYGDAIIPNWRGVQCLRHDYNLTSDSYQVDIVGLSISNASIVGTLLPDIGNLSWMTTLEVTGNPNLTGLLPSTLGNTWLNFLDVHNNGFSGAIPELPTLWNLLQMDLSGNKFTGPYPADQLSSMDYLQILNIGDNLLMGDIAGNAFWNKTELEILDISDNAFTGALPNLNRLQKVNYLDVSGNQFSGPLPDVRNLSALRTANFGRNNFTWTGRLSDTFNLSAQLTSVDLSANNLQGPLPSWTPENLGTIQELYLQNNSLSGTLDIIGMYNQGLLQIRTGRSTEKPLQMMSLSNNMITHVNYNAFIIQNISTVFKLDGNPYCAKYDSGNDGQRCFCEQFCFCTQNCFVTPAKTDSRKIILIAAISSVLAVILIVAVLVGAILYKNRRYKQYLQIQFSKKFEEYDEKPTIFSYNELRAATRDFHDDMKLGQGSYGAVYKFLNTTINYRILVLCICDMGVLPNGNVVAVKQLYIKTAQGLDEFSNEVVLITGMKHRNLVNLKGCCLRETSRLLVYEYVDNYDVDQILLGSRRQVVSWVVRLKICLGIARGLHYLHALAHPRVIHRDIKASNVLLDKNMDPKIADFRLALLFPDEQTHIMTVHVAGTKGYLAPEYALLGQLSDKVDVYSFGVLCLEIISGRRNIDESYAEDQVYLSKWAWNLHEQDRLLDLVDPTLHLTDEEVRDVQSVINMCLLCIQNAADRRPSMAPIVSILQRDTESEVLVLGEGKCEPAYKPGMRSQKNSVDNSLDSVSEDLEGGSSSSQYHAMIGNPRHGRSDDRGIAVQLSEIRAR